MGMLLESVFGEQEHILHFLGAKKRIDFRKHQCKRNSLGTISEARDMAIDRVLERGHKSMGQTLVLSMALAVAWLLNRIWEVGGPHIHKGDLFWRT